MLYVHIKIIYNSLSIFLDIRLPVGCYFSIHYAIYKKVDSFIHHLNDLFLFKTLFICIHDSAFPLPLLFFLAGGRELIFFRIMSQNREEQF